MRRALLALSLLSLLALPAAGVTRYVGPVGTADSLGTSLSSLMSLAQFNVAADSGWTALLVNGTYSANPVPHFKSGTSANPIVYRSLSAQRDGVVFVPAAGNTFCIFPQEHSAYGDSFVVWRDLTASGGDVKLGSTAYASSRWQLRNVVIKEGGLYLTNTRDSRVDSVTCIRRNAANNIFGTVGSTDSTQACVRDTISRSTLSMYKAAGTGNTGLNVFGGYDMVYDAVRCSVTTDTSQGTALRFVRIRATNRGVMRDCFFIGNNLQSGGGLDEPMTFALKDGVKAFKMERDTVILKGNNPPPYNNAYPCIFFAENETDGNPAFLGEEIGGNNIRNCYFRNETNSSLPISWYTQGFDGDSIAYNTFVVKTGGVSSRYNRGDIVSHGPTIVDHNIFATFDSTARAFYMLGDTANQAVQFTNNVFYCPTKTNADTSTARAFDLGDFSTWPADTVGPVGNNYNLAWMPNTSTPIAVAYRNYYQWASAFGMDPLKSLRGAVLLDSLSRYGALKLKDSTFYSFDAHPLSGSAALFGPDGFVGPFDVVSSPTGTTTTLASNHNPSTYGQSVTFTATVSAGTGTVTFKDAGATIGTGTLSGTQATFTLTSLTVTTHTITAVYGGDGSHSASTSSPLSQVVNKATTTTTLASSGSPSTFGQSVTFTATVTTGATGTVTFYDGATSLGTTAVASGVATLSLYSLGAGMHTTVTAVYSGDGSYLTSTGTLAGGQRVDRATSSAAVTSNRNPSTVGQAVTFTATVTPASATGSVQFLDGATVLATQALSGGSASLVTSSLTVGSHPITVAYSGDTSYLSSSSSALSQSVVAVVIPPVIPPPAAVVPVSTCPCRKGGIR